MGDRSYMNLWIYEIPEGKEEELLGVLEEYGINWASAPEASSPVEAVIMSLRHHIKAQEDFYNEDCSLGTAEEVSTILQKMGVTHQAHQDPKYEWEGVLVRYHPQLGAWSSNANADAAATMTDVDYRRLEVLARENDEGDPFEVTFVDAIANRLGIAYEDDFRDLTGQADLNGIFAEERKNQLEYQRVRLILDEMIEGLTKPSNNENAQAYLIGQSVTKIITGQPK